MVIEVRPLDETNTVASVLKYDAHDANALGSLTVSFSSFEPSAWVENMTLPFMKHIWALVAAEIGGKLSIAAGNGSRNVRE